MSEHTTETLGVLLSRYRWIDPVARLLILLPVAVSVAATEPVIAANNTTTMGTVYCNTGVESGINLLFGALIGLGLPAALYYLIKSGLSYMQAGSNPEQRRNSQQKLLMSGAGLGIIVLAIIAPNLIDKIATQIGFEFSQCVKPF